MWDEINENQLNNRKMTLNVIRQKEKLLKVILNFFVNQIVNLSNY